MGRWFGYRPGYIDACRLFISSELYEWYRHITLANEELRGELINMHQQGKTPDEYGIKVRSHHTMMITAKAKMRSGSKIFLDLSGSTIETYAFTRDKNIILHNNKIVRSFIDNLDKNRLVIKKSNLVFSNINHRKIIDLLRVYKYSDQNLKFEKELLIRYIEKQVTKNWLVNWTIGVISLVNRRKDGAEFNTENYKLIPSSRSNTSISNTIFFSNNRLAAPQDELIDLNETELKKLEKITKSKNKNKFNVVEGKKIRGKRREGLLLLYPLIIQEKFDHLKSRETDDIHIGMSISFPTHDVTSPVEYVVTNNYWEQENNEN